VPHTPTQDDVERNEVFARLIANTLKGREAFDSGQPILTWRPATVAVPA